MDKWINIISVLLMMIGGIQAQGGGFRRFMILRNRELALRRAFPFRSPLAFRGGSFPSRFPSRFAFGRPSVFGSSPLTFPEIGPTTFGSPFRTTFPPGFFDTSRFGTRSPFETGSFGITGDPGFFRGSSGFPTMGAFPEGRGFPTGPGFGEGIPPTGSGFPTGPVFEEGVPPTGSGFPTGPGFDERVPLTGSGFPSSTGDAGIREQTGGSTDTGRVSGDGRGGSTGVPDMPQISTGGRNDLNTDGRGSSMQGSNEIMPGMGPRPDTFPGAGQFQPGSGMPPGSFGGFDPRFTGQPTFGPGFGPFPGEMTGGFPDRRFDSRTPEGPSGFGQGFDQSDRAGFSQQGTGEMTRDSRFFPQGRGEMTVDSRSFPQRQGEMTRDSRFFPQGQGEMTRDSRFFGPGQFDSFRRSTTVSTPFPRDPRFESFGPRPFPGAGGRFPGPGPAFDTRGASNNPNVNMNFQPLPGNQGQFGGGPMGSNQFPGPNNNNQIVPTGTGNQAAQIDGFGAVSSTNNLNNDQSSIVSTNSNQPSDIIRFEGGAAASQPEVIMTEMSNVGAGSNNEFRVVEVGNILDNSPSAGRLTGPSTDQSVVDSMGFQSGGETNIASSRDGTETTMIVEGNRGNTNADSTLSLPSPLNQDFSFFVPAENAAGSQPQGSTFNAPAPPPPPPIMVPSNNQPGSSP